MKLPVNPQPAEQIEGKGLKGPRDIEYYNKESESAKHTGGYV